MIEKKLIDLQLKHLLILAMEGDQVAYQTFLTSTEVVVKRYLQRLGGLKVAPQTLDDLRQEVMLSIHQKKHTYLKHRPLLPWVFAITRYRYIDFYRSQKRLPQEIPLLDDYVYVEDESTVDLDEIMALLTPQQQSLLRMVKIDELPYSEAASHLGMSVSSVKVSVHRLMKTLKQKMKK